MWHDSDLSSWYHSDAHKLNTLMGRSASIDYDAVPPQPNLHDSFDLVRIPRFLSQVLTGPFNKSNEEISDDLLAGRLLGDEVFCNKFFALLNDYKVYLNFKEFKADERAYLRNASNFSSCISAANCKELSAMQVLFGAPVWHTPLSSAPHFTHATVPQGWLDRDWTFADEIAKDWKARYAPVRAEVLTLPRLTSQGVNLKTNRETSEWRVYVKVLKALIGVNAPSRVHMDEYLDKMDDVWRANGFDGVSRCFLQGVRRQATRKPEPITSCEQRYDSGLATILGESDGVQGRMRGIFMPDESVKAFHKLYADALKKMLFERINIFKVDPDHVLNAHKAIRAASDAMPNGGRDENGEMYCYIDLSGYDTTTHEGAYDMYYSMMDNLFDGFDAREGKDFLKSFSVLVPGAPSSKSEIFSHHTGGRSTLSGEPAVTPKNNVIHLMLILQALSEVTGESQMSLWRRASDDNDKSLIIKLHGDDCMRYFGDDVTVYDKVDALLAEYGFKVGREISPAYLKKHLDNGELKGIPGSLLKNRFSEYGVFDEDILYMGLYDTYQMIPHGEREYLKPIWDLISSLSPKHPPVSTVTWPYIMETVIPIIMERMTSQVGKAKEVQSLLDRMFYSSGEVLPDGLAELYGSLSFQPIDEADALGLGDKTWDELVSLSCHLQDMLIKNEGKIQSWKDWII